MALVEIDRAMAAGARFRAVLADPRLGAVRARWTGAVHPALGRGAQR